MSLRAILLAATAFSLIGFFGKPTIAEGYPFAAAQAQQNSGKERHERPDERLAQRDERHEKKKSEERREKRDERREKAEERHEKRDERRGQREERREQRQQPPSAPTPSVTAPAAPARPQRPTASEQPAVQPHTAPSTVQPPARRPAERSAPAAAGGTPPTAAPTTASPLAPPPAASGERRARRLEDVRRDRQELQVGGRTVIREPGRTIVREDGRAFIRHNEVDRFRRSARDVTVQQRGGDTVTTIVRPDGTRIVTVLDDHGRLVRRMRRDPSGREFVILDNSFRRVPFGVGLIINLPPPVIRIPRDRYIVEYGHADPALVYETLMAPPVDLIERRYTLDEVLYSPNLRDRMPRIDIDTITFDSGSWEVTSAQAARLEVIANAMIRAIRRNPSEVFLIEGHTDAVGSDVDNLSLSDRRAEAVAIILTDEFAVPPENLVTQGYGEQYLKIPTAGPERLNRRVTVRRITPLLSARAGAPR